MKKLFLLGLMVVATSSSSFASLLANDPAFSYEVIFTNPVCQQYPDKPKNVYCKPADAVASGARPDSVQTRLIEWIRKPSTKEIFFTYLSFSNSVIRDELCKAVTERNVKLTYILDTQTDLKSGNILKACQPKNGDVAFAPKMLLRGHTSGIGYSHNKIMIFNPSSAGQMSLVFSSGNMSSGVVLHHENWNFVTATSASHFMQAHLCVMNGMIDHGDTGANFKKFITDCRAAIQSPEEDDVKTFFVPGEGERATSFLTNAIQKARTISVAAHRFSYNLLIAALDEKLKSKDGSQVQLVTDDDTYWVGTTGVQVGPNMKNEYFQILKLVKDGLNVKWMQTNSSAMMFHHNKFIVFDENAVFTGAGNLTGDAFKQNFENFYYITIPSVVKSFRSQYTHLFNDLATATKDMPKVLVNP